MNAAILPRNYSVAKDRTVKKTVTFMRTIYTSAAGVDAIEHRLLI